MEGMSIFWHPFFIKNQEFYNFNIMKKLLALLSVLCLFSFIESEEIVFKSADSKTKITANDQWTAAGNMKGVEIYISRTNTVTGIPTTIVVSKDENLLEDMQLGTYSAGKLFLQTAVLKTTPSFSGEKVIDGKTFKYYEYEYDNKDLIKMKTLVYHTLVGRTGYQMTVTSEDEGFDLNKPLYNQIANSLIITE